MEGEDGLVSHVDTLYPKLVKKQSGNGHLGLVIEVSRHTQLELSPLGIHPELLEYLE